MRPLVHGIFGLCVGKMKDCLSREHTTALSVGDCRGVARGRTKGRRQVKPRAKGSGRRRRSQTENGVVVVDELSWTQLSITASHVSAAPRRLALCVRVSLQEVCPTMSKSLEGQPWTAATSSFNAQHRETCTLIV